MHGKTSSAQQPSANLQAPGGRTAAGEAPALSVVLQSVAASVQAVRAGRSGTTALETVPSALRPAVQALFFETLRHLGMAQALRRQLAPRTPAPAADALLCTALALMAPGASAAYEPHTLINQTVEAAKAQRSTRAQAGFVNACLRRFLRERQALCDAAAQDGLARWNHPPWWVQRLRQDHPQHWQDVLQAPRCQAPMVLRVNKQKSTPAQYQKALAAINLGATCIGADGLVLQRAVAVQALPGFAHGEVSVQDSGAQWAAPLLLQGLASQQPLRVLDACAAPGGKTAHLLEWAGPQARLRLTALDVDAQRCERIRATLERCQLQAQVLAADAGRPEDWWQAHCGGEPFDAILLDAPCTASGIVRRHPDVAWLRRESDVAQLAAIQAHLLRTLWPLVRPGGRLLYCTCSVFRAEGSDQIQAFLAHNTDARLMPSPGHLLPGVPHKAEGVPDNLSGEHDGFFYALLEKQPG
jgi:16S rRNA (cytosine967-C5)-methyltransferase